MTWAHWLLWIVLPALAGYGCIVGFAHLERWAAKRRASRRSALERRMRARAHCRACGSIGQIEFRGEVQRLLAQLGESDEGRAVRAVATYGRRVASGQS